MNHSFLSKSKQSLIIGLLLIITALGYLRVLDFGFYNYDDDVYVTDNKIVQQGITMEGIKWALTTHKGSNWHPLTWISHMFDCQLFGVNAKYHHAMNLFLHIVNTILLFILLNKMTGEMLKSAFVAAVFALHPLHIESVAWIAERKDVLSAFFWILTLLIYINYTNRPSVWRMILVCFSLALGLMAKPMLVSLPFVLLLLDYWPLKRFQSEKVDDNRVTINKSKDDDKKNKHPFSKLLMEKVPLFIIALISSIVTFAVQQRGGAMRFGEAIPFLNRTSNAIISYLRYIFKTFLPTDLAVFYPYPKDAYSLWQVFSVLAALVALTIIIVIYRKKYPYYFVGWLWFVGILVPVIGIVQVGWQSMADRYMYIPIIGLTMIVAWGFPILVPLIRKRQIVIGTVSSVAVCVLFFSTRYNLTYWKDDVILFEHAVAVTSDNWLAYHNLGVRLAAQGNTERALPYLIETVRIKPDFVDAHHNLGLLYAERNEDDKAYNHFNIALKLNPNFPNLQYDYGYFLFKHGKSDDAVSHLVEALRSNPSDLRARYILGTIWVGQKKYKAAVEQFSIALQIDPSFTLAVSAIENVNKIVRSQSSDTSQ